MSITGEDLAEIAGACPLQLEGNVQDAEGLVAYNMEYEASADSA